MNKDLFSKVKLYQWTMYDLQNDLPPFLTLHTVTGEGGTATFSDSPAKLKTFLKKRKKNTDFTMNYRKSDLPLIVDMLRNEGPVYVSISSTFGNFLSTRTEKIGEGES